MGEPRPYFDLIPNDAIWHELDYQDAKWGGPPHDRQHTMAEWALILSREFGEAQDALGAIHWGRDDKGTPGQRYGNARSELIQVAAVCVAICNMLDTAAARDEEYAEAQSIGPDVAIRGFR
jgi:NTP pyrophosphatase (non-canonical NTP hydrolase)